MSAYRRRNPKIKNFKNDPESRIPMTGSGSRISHEDSLQNNDDDDDDDLMIMIIIIIIIILQTPYLINLEN